VNGPAGPSLYLDDYRIAGPKPWGGGTVLHEFAFKDKDLIAAGVTLATPAPLDVRQFAEELIAQIGGMMVTQRETKSATESMRGAYSDVLAIISDRLATLAATPAPLDIDAPDNANAATTSANATPAPLDEPDPDRTGMPKCSCGDIAYRPDPIEGRKQAWRCGGCHRTLGRCSCATPAPLDVLYGFPKSYTEPEAAAWIAGARATLAATPAPLDVLVAASEALTKFEWGRNGQGVCSWCGWARGTYDSDAHGFDCPLATVRAALATPAPPDEPDPDRTGMPKCPCGDIAYRPNPIEGRKQAWRCGGCHRTLGRCNCATPAPLDEWQQGYDAGYKEGQEDANLIAPTPLAPGPRAIVDGCICQKCADRGDECDYGAEPNHDECSLCERGRHVRERDREDEMEQES